MSRRLLTNIATCFYLRSWRRSKPSSICVIKRQCADSAPIVRLPKYQKMTFNGAKPLKMLFFPQPCQKQFHSLASRLYSFQAYVYDVRSSAYLHRLPKFTETVLNVSFNPATPEVRTLVWFMQRFRHTHRHWYSCLPIVLSIHCNRANKIVQTSALV